MPRRTPAWTCLGEEVQLDGGAAAAGASKGRGPRLLVEPEEIYRSGLGTVREVRGHERAEWRLFALKAPK